MKNIEFPKIKGYENFKLDPRLENAAPVKSVGGWDPAVEMGPGESEALIQAFKEYRTRQI